MAQDVYRALGVRVDAPSEEIRRTYRKLARSFHPDKNIGASALVRRICNYHYHCSVHDLGYAIGPFVRGWY